LHHGELNFFSTRHTYYHDTGRCSNYCRRDKYGTWRLCFLLGWTILYCFRELKGSWWNRQYVWGRSKRNLLIFLKNRLQWRRFEGIVKTIAPNYVLYNCSHHQEFSKYAATGFIDQFYWVYQSRNRQSECDPSEGFVFFQTALEIVRMGSVVVVISYGMGFILSFIILHSLI